MEPMDHEVTLAEGLHDTENLNMEWIVYTKGETEEPFEYWLQKTKPSTIDRKSGYMWVCVRHEPSHGWADEPDIDRLHQSWESLQVSQHSINFQTIKALALDHNVKSGKWMLFANSGGKIDHLWYIIANAIINNKLPCNSAKVSTYDETGSHVICIYNEDFSDYDQVLSAEQAIRNMGIKGKMMYKPDIYSYLNIYRNNSYGFKPFIMVSNYDIMRGSSVIESLI